MTIAEAIAALEKVPADKRHLPLYAWDNDHLRITGITPFDTAQPHNEDNPLGIDLDHTDRSSVMDGVLHGTLVQRTTPPTQRAAFDQLRDLDKTYDITE